MSKRGNGEGHINRRADGRWEAKVTVGWEGGRRVRRSFYGKTRADAATRLNEVLERLRKGMSPEPDARITVEKYLARWLDESAKPNVRPRTFELYELLIRRHVVPEIGRQRLVKLSPVHVQTMLNRCTVKGLSPRTVAAVRSVLRQALQQALRWGLVYQNVATLVDVPPASSEPARPFSLDEARTFLGCIEGHRLYPLFATAIMTGMRRGEILALRWDDFDPGRMTLTVSGALQRVDGALVRSQPKTRQSRRTVAIPESLAATLKSHGIRQKEERLRAGAAWHDSGLIFTTTIGTALEPRNITRLFSQLVASSNLRPQRFHDLRHCFATLQLAEGTHARVVMEQLGHAQISTTLDIYSHVTANLHRESADRIGALFG